MFKRLTFVQLKKEKQNWSSRSLSFTSFHAVFFHFFKQSRWNKRWKSICSWPHFQKTKKEKWFLLKVFFSYDICFKDWIKTIFHTSHESKPFNSNFMFFAGSAVAPLSSGNGPDTAHLPITRSPVAQERGTSPSTYMWIITNIKNWVLCYVWQNKKRGNAAFWHACVFLWDAFFSLHFCAPKPQDISCHLGVCPKIKEITMSTAKRW